MKAQAFKNGMTPSAQVSAWFTKDTSAVIPSGLVAAYGFNETTGTATSDSSGNGNNGTLINGPVFVAGKNGNAINLDGANDYVNLGNPASLQLTGSMTIDAWINSSAFPVDDAAVVSKRSDTEIGFQLDTTIDKGPRTIGFKLTNSSGGKMFRYGATALQLNQWYHVAGVYDAATQTLNVYLNGQLDNGALVGTVTSSQQNPSLNTVIGRRSGFTGFEFSGKIDDVRIYNRALSQAEVQQDMITAIGGSTAPTAFDFAIGNGGNVSVTQGQSVTNTVTATLSSGSPQTVSFSTTGLPSGATASYTTSNSCTPSCSLNLNIATSASTPAGTYTITATGTGGGVTKTTNFSLTVNSPTMATVATPTISPNGGSFTGSVSVTIQTATSGASIYYTTDGSTPTQLSTLYSGPMNLTSSATVKAVAFKSGSNPSAVASASFTVVTPPAQLTLTWQDNSTNESNFGVERKTGTSGTYAQIALVSANTTSYVDTSVTHGVTYCYRVDALNSAGASAYTNEVCAAAHNQ